MDSAIHRPGERFVMRCRWKGGIVGSVLVDGVTDARARAAKMRENRPGELLECAVRHYVDAGTPVMTWTL